MKAWIDTNVVLDALIKREPWHTDAEKIILLAAIGEISACVSASCVTDIYYILRKYLKDNTRTRDAVLKLLKILTVADVTASDIEKAFSLPVADFEDALQIQLAKRHKAACLVTRDTKHFTSSPVKIFTPEEFLKKIGKN
jgi:predicted nucleic acid-binding protein